MKYIAIFLIILVIAAGCAVGYTLYTTTLTVLKVDVKIVSGNDRQNDFSVLQKAMDNRAVPGTSYAESMPGDASDYVFMTYYVYLQNKCLLPAEMIEIQIQPAEGDVICFTSSDANDINTSVRLNAGDKRMTECTLVTSAAEGTTYNVARTIYITYYIWGHAFTQTVTGG